MQDFKKYLKFLAICVLLGISGGIIGAAFSISIGLVTQLRQSNGWLICLLPIASLLIVFIYKLLGISDMGTNSVLKSADDKNALSSKLPLGIVVCSIISHTLGASVGREGAALQIGGGAATFFAQKFGLSNRQRQILVRAGMSAVFAAVFGTPLAAFFFALEIVRVGVLHIKSTIPCFLTAFTGYYTALFFGAHPERFNLLVVPKFSFDIAWKIGVLTLLVSLLSIGFCYSLKYTSKFAKSFIKNPYIRISLGGAIVLLLTVIVGNQDYNGAGVHIVEHIFEASFNPSSLSFRPEAFLLKLIFTSVCVAAGFKGGEIVPTLFIGATFGALVATVLGFSVGFGAALGMILLFCGVTNCPLASLFLGIELFSGVGMYYLLPTIAVCFFLSGKVSLYSAQKTPNWTSVYSLINQN